MKKRILALFLGAAVVLSLSACGTSGDGGAGKEPDNSSEVSEQVPSEQLPSKQVSEPSGGENSGDDVQPAGSGDLGDYHVEIKGASLAKDYEGKSAIVVTYAWTNNSEETTSAMVSVGAKAFQECAYVLTSETSTVEFELTEWISFSDDMVTMNFDPAALA